MKKIIIRILSVLVGLLVLYVVINLFDAGEPTADFSAQDIPTGTFDKSNGYYRLWTLIEPEGTDVQADEVINRVRRMFDPQHPEFEDGKYIVEFDLETHKKKGSVFKKLKLLWPKAYDDKEWVRSMLSQKKTVRKFRKEFKVYLERYRRLIDTEVFEDFTLLRWDSPIPNLLAWLRIAKLYIGINVLDAVEGNWQQGVSNILDQLDFGKRAVKGSHVMITDLVAKAVTQVSIKAIVDLMNQKECPREVFQQVLDRTPPLEYDEYGSRTSFIGEGLAVPSYFEFVAKTKGFLARFLYWIFFHKNRIKKVHYANASNLLKYEKTPPYKWEKDLEEAPALCTGWFWWLQNPLGKSWYDKDKVFGNLHKVIYKSYRLKAFYEMLRISAELHLNYTPDKPVRAILDGLESYRTLQDSCSGKPYVWNDEKQILYSIGIDREDNGGETQQYERIKGMDYPIPVILYLK